MPIFSQQQIDHAAEDTRRRYIELAAAATEPAHKRFYDFLAHVSPEVSRWSMGAIQQGAVPTDVVRAFERGMAALYCLVGFNSFKEADAVPAALNMIANTALYVPEMMHTAQPGSIVKKLDS